MISTRLCAGRSLNADPLRGFLGEPLVNIAMNSSGATLWDALGGEHVLARVVDRFVELATTDPNVNYSRGGRYPINDATLAFSKRAALEFISAATGGPYSYSGKTLREIHAGMRISDQEFDAITANFRRALEDNGVSHELAHVAVGMVNATRAEIVETR